jgi:Integrase core domain
MKHMDTSFTTGTASIQASRRGIEIDGLDRIENAIQIAPGECRLRTLQSAQRAESVCTMIPLNEGHVRQTLKGWLAHYNHGRPHSSLGPGIPKPLGPNVEQQTQRHRNSDDHRITKTPILNGLHHEYRLERIAA